MAKKASKLLEGLRKTTGSSSFKESRWANAPHYISTGDYGVNQIISGSIYKGIPAGKVTVFAGESGSLKTIQVIRVAANALNMLDYDVVFYFDSEGGAPAKMFENFGCDLDKIEHILVESTEDATIKMVKTLKTIEQIQKDEDPNFKAVVILDSLGNLENDKTFNDIDNNRLAADQGAAAKVKNKLCRAMTVPALKTGTPVLIINWVYDGPSMYPKKIKDQPGGKGSEFVGSINVQCTRTLVKSETDDNDNFYDKSTVTMFTVKNREVTPYLQCQVHVSFTEGLNLFPYLSLFESACDLGFIIRESTQFYSVPSWSANPAKKWRRKELLGGTVADEVWETFIKEYDEAAQKKIQYSSVTKEAIQDLGFTEEQAAEMIEHINDEEKDDADTAAESQD